ncbi:MAG: MBL fold metallo-hydrolase [Chloroflexota bacterium]|nr:MAG: MBL fold metallo-hydrolase [Chloroflexota bacterium]
MIDRIQWLGHSSFMIQGPPLIYIDPWRVARSAFHADIILISSNLYDRCSLADIDKLRGPETLVIGSETVAQQVENCTVLRPWQSLTVDRAAIKAVPACTSDAWGQPIVSGLGFVISINLYDIYYAGPTQITPEMDTLRPDIAILPIDGRGTLNVADAAQVIRQMRPRWVFPANWGVYGEGAARSDALALQRLTAGQTEVVIRAQTLSSAG